MITGVLDRIPLDEITATAVHDIQPARTVAKLLIGLFYLAGRAAGKLSVGLRMAAGAVKVGWTEARAEAGIEPRKPATGRAGRA